MIDALACMATAIFFEARGEPMVGQVAVAQVIMHRVNDHRYPDNVCDVVKQGYYYSWNTDVPILHKCQFSFGVMARMKIPVSTLKLIFGQKKWQGA